MSLLAAEQVVRSEPAAHAFGLKDGVEPVGERLILRRIANEQRVDLDPRADQRRHVFDEILWNAGPTEKNVWDLAFGLVDRIDANPGWAMVSNSF